MQVIEQCSLITEYLHYESVLNEKSQAYGSLWRVYEHIHKYTTIGGRCVMRTHIAK